MLGTTVAEGAQSRGEGWASADVSRVTEKEMGPPRGRVAAPYGITTRGNETTGGSLDMRDPKRVSASNRRACSIGLNPYSTAGNSLVIASRCLTRRCGSWASKCDFEDAVESESSYNLSHFSD
jgi:hypothetical protein